MSLSLACFVINDLNLEIMCDNLPHCLLYYLSKIMFALVGAYCYVIPTDIVFVPVGTGRRNPVFIPEKIV